MTEQDMLELNTVTNVDEDAQEGKYLTFSLGKEAYGIEIRNVTEIIGIQHVTKLPDTPPFVKGVINLRGKVIPVLDVRLRFDLKERKYDDRTCIIVVNIRNMSVGLIVDTVSEVLDVPFKNIEAPPKIKNCSGNRYILGLGKVGSQVMIILDSHKLLFGDEVEQIADAIV